MTRINDFSVLIFFLTCFTFVSCECVPKEKEKVKILIAMREASIGGIRLTLYNDSTFEMGNLRATKWTGKFKKNNDTLLLLSKDTIVTSFLFQGQKLVEVTNTGIGFLDVGLNSLQ